MTRWLVPASVAALATAFIAVMGATITVIGPWYKSLNQPPWAPPDMAFGPAWTLIFALCAMSAVTAWLASPDRNIADTINGMFAFNGVLNLLWSFLFFQAHRPDLAAIEVWFLWLSIALLIRRCWQFSRGAAWLLVPYLAWVTFAGALNVAVVMRNGPFG
ncbi:MAG: TspO/MBR family protein [Polymorphobacter sp.]